MMFIMKKHKIKFILVIVVLLLCAQILVSKKFNVDRLRVAVDQHSSLNDQPDLGAWAPARNNKQDVIDEKEYFKLLALGYAQGSNTAPEFQNVTEYNSDLAYDGLNFYTSGHAPEAAIIDMEGNIVHEWHFKAATHIWPDEPNDLYGSYWRRAHVNDNGDLLAIYNAVGLIKIDKNSNLIWDYHDNKKPHHDIEVTEDGKIYLLTRESRWIPRIYLWNSVLEDFITILNPDGTVIKHISLLNLLEKSPYNALVENIESQSIKNFRGDLFHTNTIEVFDGKLEHKSPLFKKGNILVCFLAIKTIAIIDMESEQIVWVLGSGIWKQGQHQPTLLENGNILIFDNHYTRESSRVMEIEPFSKQIVWEYRGDDKAKFYSRTCGSNQRLPNGNTLITETDYGRAFEVTNENNIVWEFLNPHRIGDKNELIAVITEMIRIDPEHYPFLKDHERDFDGLLTGIEGGGDVESSD